MLSIGTRTRLTTSALLLLLPLVCFGQTPEGALDELTLGLRQQAKILSEHPKLDDETAALMGNRAFVLLLETPTRKSGPSLPYELTLVQDSVVNAYSTASGKIYITSAMIPLLGNDLGLWAAVLGHELGHCVAQHQYKAYLRAYEKVQFRQGLAQILGQRGVSLDTINAVDKATQVGLGLLGMKLSRDDESQADALGLKMLAEAGFHPDHAITLIRRMRNGVGDQSKLATFFALDHPRWATREERTMKLYGDALGVFQSRFPDTALSPGGLPPLVATIDPVEISQDTTARAAIVKIHVSVRNARNARGQLLLRFWDKNVPVVSTSPQYSVDNGRLGADRAFRIDSSDYSSEFIVSVPSSAVGTKHRNLSATVTVIADGQVLEQSAGFAVPFPKP